MTVGIYGGTFDPVHNGHVVIAAEMIERIPLEKLIMMPAYIPPHKRGDVCADFERRLEWLKRAFEGVKRVEVSDFEGRTNTVSYTFKTIEHLEKRYGRLAYVMGEDSFVNIQKWYKYVELLEKVDLYVYPRYCDNSKTRGILEEMGSLSGNVRVMYDMPIVQFSSTMIRQRCENFLSIRGYVPECLESDLHRFYSKS